MESTFKLINKHKIKTLEEETMLGLYDIIERMYKHAVKDYINVISYYYDEDFDKPKSEVEFNKIFTKNFFEMFEHIKDDLEYRVQNLKLKLMKRFDIESDFKELLSESESESESESDDKKRKTKNLKPIPGRPIEFKLTDDDKLEIDSKCLTNVEDPDESESESESENKKIKTLNSKPKIRFKLSEDGKLEFDNGITKTTNFKILGPPIELKLAYDGDEPKSESEIDN